MSGKLWSEEDVKLLRAAIHVQTIPKIAEILGRSVGGVKGKMLALGLSVRKVRAYQRGVKASDWTLQEISTLKKYAGSLPAYLIGKKLNRSERAVKSQASRLGVSLQKNPWSTEDLDRVKELRDSNLSWPEVSKILGRTPEACRAKYNSIYR